MINKLSNIAFGFNDQTSAKKAIEKLLADEIAEARKKALVQAALTPEALLEKQQKRQASAAAAKATKERKKAAAPAAAAAAAASTNANTNVALIADAIAAVPSTVVPSTAPCTDDTFSPITVAHDATPTATNVAPTAPTTISTIVAPTTISTTVAPTAPTSVSSTVAPTAPTTVSTTVAPTAPTTVAPTASTTISTTFAPTTVSTTVAPTAPTSVSSTVAPTAPTTVSTTVAPTATNVAPTAPTTVSTTVAPTAPTTAAPPITVAPTTAPTLLLNSHLHGQKKTTSRRSVPIVPSTTCTPPTDTLTTTAPHDVNPKDDNDEIFYARKPNKRNGKRSVPPTATVPSKSANDFLATLETVSFIREVHSSCSKSFPGYFKKNILIDTIVLIGSPVMVKV
jgi:hypothetical protein